MELDLAALQQRLADFADARDWAQFHTPKNLVLALAGEVGELAAVLQWLTDGEVSSLVSESATKQPLVEEMADVLIYLVRLADVCGVDLLAAAHAKIDGNERRYPVDLALGSGKKYSQLAADSEHNASGERL